MRQSTFEPCLLYTDKRGLFNKLGLNTDDTLFLANEEFAALEGTGLKSAMILGKPVEVLLLPNPLLSMATVWYTRTTASASPRKAKLTG